MIRDIVDEISYLERTVELAHVAATEEKFDRVVIFLESLSLAAIDLIEKYKKIFQLPT